MNAHACPICRQSFWVIGNLGDVEPVPKHTPTGQIVKGKRVDVLCLGSRKKAQVVKPPYAS